MGKKVRKPWSSYWMGDALTRYSESTSDAERLVRLSNIRKGIANFVNILTGTDIPVKFSSGQMSYTDGRRIVVISARNEPDKFDAQVGRALHEATHVLRSQRLFLLLEALDSNPLHFIPEDIFDAGAQLKRTAAKVKKDFHLLLNFLEDRRNDLWGYRQAPGYRPYYDAHYAQCFYSKYIDEALRHPVISHIPTLKVWELHILNMFNKYADPDALPGLREIWNIIDLPNIERYDNDPKWELWEEKARGVRLFPGSFGSPPSTRIQTWNTNVLKNMTAQLPDMVVDAQKILRIIYANAVYIKVTADKGKSEKSDTDQTPQFNPFEVESNDPEDADMNEFGDGSPEESEDFSDMPDYDISDQEDGEEDGASEDSSEGTESDSEGINLGKKEKEAETAEEIKAAKKKMKKALRRQEAEVRGETPKDSLTPDDAETLDHMEASGADLREVYDAELGNAKCKVIVYKNVTEDTLKIPSLGFSSVYNGVLEPCRDSVKAIEEGKILGNLLAHRIRIMNDEGVVRTTRQKQGRFDKRLAASIATDNENLFFRTHTAAIEPVMVDLSIDASGSMAGEKWEKAMALSIALVIAAAKVRSFRIRINVRASWGDVANVGVIYDSKRDNMSKIDTMFKYLHPNGSTPEGLCYDAMQKELLEEIKQVRRFFVNLSDGEPSFSFSDSTTGSNVAYWGAPACRHTKRQVDKLQQMGVRILSFFICDGYYDAKRLNTRTGSADQFRMMYGKNATYINPKDITEIAFQLNKLFLSQ